MPFGFTAQGLVVEGYLVAFLHGLRTFENWILPKNFQENPIFRSFGEFFANACAVQKHGTKKLLKKIARQYGLLAKRFRSWKKGRPITSPI